MRRHESVSRAKHSRSVHLPFSSRFTHLPPCPPPPPPPPLAATALTLAKRAATRSILIFLRCSVGDCDYKLAAPRNGFFIWPPFFEYKTNVFCAKKSGGALGRAGGGRLRRGRALSSLGMFTRPTVRELRGESLGRRGRRGVRVCAFALWVCAILRDAYYTGVGPCSTFYLFCFVKTVLKHGVLLLGGGGGVPTALLGYWSTVGVYGICNLQLAYELA